MFGFKKKKRNSDRERMREEFDQLITMALQGPQIKRKALGHSINTINGFFYGRFGSLQEFMDKNKTEQCVYLKELYEMQERLPDDDEIQYVAINLFIKWLVSIVEKDKDSMILFTEGLTLVCEGCDPEDENSYQDGVRQ